MFNTQILAGNSPYEFLQKYYLAEARAISSIFGQALDDIVAHVRYVIDNVNEFTPLVRDQIDYNTTRKGLYIGWQFDAENNRAVYVDKDTPEYHMIKLQYQFHPEYAFKFSVDERIYYGSSNDDICLNINVPIVQEMDLTDQQMRLNIVHEFTHSLQMWVDPPGRVTKQDLAYQDFIADTYYLQSRGIKPDFIADTRFKALSYAIYFLSSIECEAIREEIEEYIRLNGRIEAMSNDISLKTYIEDFLRKFSIQTYNIFATTRNVLSRFHEIKNTTDFDSEPYKGLVLFTSILVDKEFIKDTYHKKFADYKQCILIQENKYAPDKEITDELLKAIGFLAEKMDEFIYDAEKEIRESCKKYKVNEVLEKESIHKDTKSEWDYPKTVYESKSPFLQKKKNGYQDYSKMLEYWDNASQMEYLSESIELLFLNLFDEDPWQVYGDNAMNQCIVPHSLFE